MAVRLRAAMALGVQSSWLLGRVVEAIACDLKARAQGMPDTERCPAGKKRLHPEGVCHELEQVSAVSLKYYSSVIDFPRSHPLASVMMSVGLE